MKEFERNIRIAISPVCNMNCIYCIGDNRNIHNRRMAAMEDIRDTPLSNGCISTEQLLDILNIFKKLDLMESLLQVVNQCLIRIGIELLILLLT